MFDQVMYMSPAWYTSCESVPGGSCFCVAAEAATPTGSGGNGGSKKECKYREEVANKVDRSMVGAMRHALGDGGRQYQCPAEPAALPALQHPPLSRRGEDAAGRRPLAAASVLLSAAGAAHRDSSSAGWPHLVTASGSRPSSRACGAASRVVNESWQGAR